MARIAGVNIPENKHVEISLTHIFGIGRKTAQNICIDLKIDYTKKISDPPIFLKVRGFIKYPFFLFIILPNILIYFETCAALYGCIFYSFEMLSKIFLQGLMVVSLNSIIEYKFLLFGQMKMQ